ncbi:hypothetical protein [Paludibaculum fermentans]|uniref:Uncharacterized protein n=1 Tax=Paludibaculum fermentans TaxID=1473598 RepID=A0A7S7NK23_PALFE|nr:hypothetical protein [Paludibaculum fermentans]QOY85078.1 hypothetical protein IRI77_19760 [Paludibaculum fermentans]
MSALPKLPDVTVIGTLLSGILGRKVVVAKAPPLDLGPKVAKVFGVYREAATGRICLCVVDLVFAANAAGAMLVFPPYAVATAIRAGKLDNDLMETIREILNICSRCFHDEARVVLAEVCSDLNSVPADVLQMMKAPLLRFDVSADITGYAAGRLTLMLGKPVQG